MIARYNNLSLVLGIPGLIAQAYGYYMKDKPQSQLGWVIMTGGTVMLIAGLMYYAKAKGRNPNWAFLGFFSLIGLVILALLKDHAKDGKTPDGRLT